MRVRHQQGDNFPLTLEEILDETNQTDVGMQMRHWLNTEALRNNPKIAVTEEDKFEYKPKFTIKGKDSLRRLLEKRYVRGQGGIMMEDVEESLPNAQKVVKVRHQK
jgi:transcription initiation factor TFIIE subunit beta